MIDDLSQTLRTILTQPGLPSELGTAQIVFDHPIEAFNPQQTTINLFLYDIRENLGLRSNELQVMRNNGKVTTRKPPLRVACSYLVTAWPVGGAEVALQEHRLLGQVLHVFARHPTIPFAFLQGSLAGQESPLPMVTALVDPQKNLSEFWTALGNKLRPSLTVTVTIAMDLRAPDVEPMIVTEEVRFGQRTRLEQDIMPGGTSEASFRIGGVVTDRAGVPVAEATVTVVELGRMARTDTHGRFRLSRISSGTHTLRVQKGTTGREVQIEIPSAMSGDFNVQLTDENQ